MSNTRQPLSFGIVILAAGNSRRMGTPKMLLPWFGTSILGYVIEQWHSMGVAQIAVVLGSESSGVARELDRLHFPVQNRIQNPAPDRGMFSSIQCAANWQNWMAVLTHWVICLGDQPHLQLSTYRQLLEFAQGNRARVCQPLWRKEWRHPVVMPKTLFERLKTSEAFSLKVFLMSCDRAGCECNDPGLDYDIDTPEDYQKALAFTQSTRERPASPTG